MKKIIIYSRFFRPAIKAGGPIQSIENILKIFGKKYNLLLVTGDRDIDNRIFKNVKFNKIQIKKYFKILYLQKDRQNIQEHFKIIKSFKPDVIYLNSFFDFKFSILLSLLNKFIFNQKLIISPRGELLSEAVQSKVFKKKFYIFFTKIFKIYSNAVFHINSIKEKKNLIHRIGRKTKFKIVPVFYPSLKKTSLKSLNFERSKFKILFVSRIVKNKNLDLCIKILNEIKFNCEFNIIGEKEDLNYWKNCSYRIKKLRKNIYVRYLGVKSKKGVFSLMRKSHCLLHPSKFESYGHVIFESLLNGLPVIISNNTPWQNLKKKKVGNNLPINNIKKFVDEINYLKTCSNKDYLNYRKKALWYANKKIQENKFFTKRDIF